MKLSLKLAVGAALTMASMGAFAQLSSVPTPPYSNLNLAASNNGSTTLTLFSSDDATPFSYSFNLGVNLNDLLVSPTKSLTWSLTGLNLGSVPTSSLLFEVSAGAVKGSINTVAGADKLLTTVDLSETADHILTETNLSLQSAISQGDKFLTAGIGSTGTAVGGTGFTGTTNPYSTKNTTDPGYANANYGQGYNQLFVNTAGSTSSALPFYELISAKGANNTIASASLLAGTWSIDLVADTLTYTVSGGSTNVPLPPSVWLLLSGIAGAVVLGRRRKDLSVNDVGTLAV